MNFQQVLLIILSGLGVFHGLFLAFYLWSRREGLYLSNRLLALLMLCLSIRIGKSVALEFMERLDILFVYLGLVLLMFIGPLFLLYAKVLSGRTNSFPVHDLIHFIPGIAFALMAVPFRVIGFRNLPQLIAVGLFAVFYLHYLGYLIYTRKVIMKMNNQSPDLTRWLNILFLGLLSIWIVYVLNLFEEAVPYIVGPVLYSLTVYLITYIAITRRYIAVLTNIKYQSGNISESDTALVFAMIQKGMAEEKLFLNPDLTLSALAKKFGVTAQKISLSINARAGCNFNDYINRHRVNHARELLASPASKTVTIAAIAHESGFNSLSTFNTAFRKSVGKTPSGYRKDMTESGSSLTE